MIARITPDERLADPVAWSDVENGAYVADLALWEELAAASDGPVLELGCGSGRVALHLAHLGHRIVGVDTDTELIAAVAERGGPVGVEAEVADMRTLDLGRRFGLVLAPMQVTHLLPRSADRTAMLRGVAAHLSPSGVAAFALLDEATISESWFSTEVDDLVPDVREIDGWVYSSQPIAFGRSRDGIELRRRREVVSPGGAHLREEATIRFADLPPERLEAEAAEAGLVSAGRRTIPATEDHVGSNAVLLNPAPQAGH